MLPHLWEGVNQGPDLGLLAKVVLAIIPKMLAMERAMGIEPTSEEYWGERWDLNPRPSVPQPFRVVFNCDIVDVDVFVVYDVGV